MRPAVAGNQIKMHSNRFIGLNVGFNYHNDHEGGVDKLVQDINSQVVVKRGLTGVSRQDKQDFKKMQCWRNTPYGNNILHPRVEIYKRNIEIRHNDRDLSDRILNDAEYIMLLMGAEYPMDMYKRYIGQKRIFSESDLMDMKDYSKRGMQSNSREKFCALVDAINRRENYLRGSWGSYGGMMMIMLQRDNISERLIVPTIEKSLKCGSLALIDSEPRLFKQRGCILICLDEAYKPV